MPGKLIGVNVSKVTLVQLNVIVNIKEGSLPWKAAWRDSFVYQWFFCFYIPCVSYKVDVYLTTARY